MSETTEQGSRPSIEQLEAVFHNGGKGREQWKIGAEYEKPVVDAATGDAVAWEGPRGIGALLQRMLDASDTWEGIYEGESLVALRDGNASITLEPGGQLEMSGRQCDSLHCAREELTAHTNEILAAGDPLGLAFLSLGITPKTPLAEMPWMPKERYRFMRRIMENTGTLGHRMMLQTATVQCNLDYVNEADAARKIRLATALSPLLFGLSANSPIVDGAETGYQSYRAHVWLHTDPARCGFPGFIFDTENLFGAWTQYALDVPMYFIQRGGALLDSGNKTFRLFLESGHSGHQATLDDWNLHLTTLFPEVRLKTYLEIRSADSQPTDLLLATPALMKGLLYDDDCMQAAWDEASRWPLAELRQLQEDAARDGMDTRIGRHNVQTLARELTAIAREGLRRQAAAKDPEPGSDGPETDGPETDATETDSAGQSAGNPARDASGRDESIYLEPLMARIESGKAPAVDQLEGWRGAWDGDIRQLVEFSRYRPA